MTPVLRLAALLFGALALACAGSGDGGALALSTEAVAGGEISGPAEDFVVEIEVDEPEPYDDYVCSGTLVAPNLLLTALHCVSVFDGRPYACRPDGSAVPSGAGWIGEPLDPQHVAVYFGTQLPFRAPAAHGVEIFGTHATFACTDDLAFVVLDTALPAGGVALRNERPVVKGESLTVIGYGQNDFPETARVRRSGMTVVEVGPEDTSAGLGSVPPRSFVVDEGPCAGDAGAPALSQKTGALVGVFRQPLAGDCLEPGSHGAFVEVAPLMELAARAFEAAGVAPRLETHAASRPAGGSSCTLAAASGEPVTAAAALALLGLFFSRRRRER
jgi:MYXO-CTERM domain-containing protein